MSFHVPENELAGTPYTITVTSPGRVERVGAPSL